MSDKPVTNGFAPVCLLGDSEGDRPRTFVELWDTKDWPDVLAHLGKLPGISDVNFRDVNQNEPPLMFTFLGHRFSFYRADGDYLGVVDDPECPDEILLRVAHHLNSLLCPITTFQRTIGFCQTPVDE